MARLQKRLTDVFVRTTTAAGRHNDGGGLHLSVSQSGAKSWVFIWQKDGRRREMGLGGYPAVKLAAARKKAEATRTAISEGRDPIEEKRRPAVPTFAEASEMLCKELEPGWRHPSTECSGAPQSKRIAVTWPTIVSEIGTEDVLGALKPIWVTTHVHCPAPSRAHRAHLKLRKGQGLADRRKPAAWRGHLDHMLARRSRSAPRHLKALPYTEVAAFLRRLRAERSATARLIELVVLTAVRSGEARLARWDEIDLDAKLWTLPAERMKVGKPHVVPLSSSAVQVLTQLAEMRQSGMVFPGKKSGQPLSIGSPDRLSRAMKVQGSLTVHGFRSAFRDWAGNETRFPREIAEEALAHAVGNAVERAYRRGSALEKRRQLMQAWADYVERHADAKVVQLHA